MNKPFTTSVLREITDLYESGDISYSKMVEMLNEVAMKWKPDISKMETTEIGNFYPIWIRSEKYKKLLCIMTVPEYKIWYKDQEVTVEELIEILNKQP